MNDLFLVLGTDLIISLCLCISPGQPAFQTSLPAHRPRGRKGRSLWPSELSLGVTVPVLGTCPGERGDLTPSRRSPSAAHSTPITLTRKLDWLFVAVFLFFSFLTFLNHESEFQNSRLEATKSEHLSPMSHRVCWVEVSTVCFPKCLCWSILI